MVQCTIIYYYYGFICTKSADMLLAPRTESFTVLLEINQKVYYHLIQLGDYSLYSITLLCYYMYIQG